MNDYDMCFLGDKKYVSLPEEHSCLYPADLVEEYALEHDLSILQVLYLLTAYEPA